MVDDGSEVKIDVLVERVSNLTTRVDWLRQEYIERIDTLKNDMLETDAATVKRLDAIEGALRGFSKMADRWKGGTLLLIGIGTVLGWAVNFLGSLAKVVR